MADANRHDDEAPGKEHDAPAARRYTIWLVMWTLIALALLTWIFA